MNINMPKINLKGKITLHGVGLNAINNMFPTNKFPEIMIIENTEYSVTIAIPWKTYDTSHIQELCDILKNACIEIHISIYGMLCGWYAQGVPVVLLFQGRIVELKTGTHAAVLISDDAIDTANQITADTTDLCVIIDNGDTGISPHQAAQMADTFKTNVLPITQQITQDTKIHGFITTTANLKLTTENVTGDTLLHNLETIVIAACQLKLQDPAKEKIPITIQITPTIKLNCIVIF